MPIIDTTYFQNGNTFIPNWDKDDVGKTINWFIQDYEPKFLEDVLGYELYAAMLAGVTINLTAPTQQRWSDLIYGKVYTNTSGDLKKWKGLLYNLAPAYQFSNGFHYKPAQYPQVDITTGWTQGSAAMILDGSSGKDDWRGWKPVLERVGSGTMAPNVDYNFDPLTGSLTIPNRQPLERFFAQFEIQIDEDADISVTAFKQSPVANYVYCKYMEAHNTSSTGIGEVKPKAVNAGALTVGYKMTIAWNEMSKWLQELREYLNASESTYPEWENQLFLERRYGTVNMLGI